MIRICDLFGVNRYKLPPIGKLPLELKELTNDIFENRKFLEEAENSISTFLKERIGSAKDQEPGKFDLYRKFFKKENPPTLSHSNKENLNSA